MYAIITTTPKEILAEKRDVRRQRLIITNDVTSANVVWISFGSQNKEDAFPLFPSETYIEEVNPTQKAIYAYSEGSSYIYFIE